MIKLKLILIACVISTSAFTQWKRIPEISSKLVSMNIVQLADTLWLSNGYRYYKSIDRGKTWQKTGFPLRGINRHLYDIKKHKGVLYAGVFGDKDEAILYQSFDTTKHIIISLASGVNIDTLTHVLGNEIALYRAMPNTAANVSNSMTCICTAHPEPETDDVVQACFDAIGETVIIDEKLMDAATVLGACGIAYVLRFMRAMIQGGIQIGFDSKTATKIVSHTIQGASELIIQKQNHPEHEIDKVTTPKGCTIEGLNEMEHHGFSSALIKGIVTSFENIEKAK